MNPVADHGPLRRQWHDDDRVLSLHLSRPKANIIDSAMCQALASGLDTAALTRTCRAVVLSHDGPHFSFGASIAEHLPESCAAMLATFHKLLLEFYEAAVPVLTVVRGQCLGGGLELALATHRLFAGADAAFGCPELKLGVFAPAATLLLPSRLRPAQAQALLLSGESVDACQAAALGLVDTVVSDPFAAALDYARTHYYPKSASSLRVATQAARACLAPTFRNDLARLEHLYLDRLMRTHDALEGIRAFIEKRPPQWKEC